MTWPAEAAGEPCTVSLRLDEFTNVIDRPVQCRDPNRPRCRVDVHRCEAERALPGTLRESNTLSPGMRYDVPLRYEPPSPRHDHPWRCTDAKLTPLQGSAPPCRPGHGGEGDGERVDVGEHASQHKLLEDVGRHREHD